MAKRHVVKAGECLPAIAERYGFGDYRLVYDAPENAELRRQRPNPSLLHPGDVVTIPEPQRKMASGPTGKQHSFVVHRPERVLRLVLKDHELKPLAGEPYELHFKSGPSIVGKSTDGAGKLEEPVPARAVEATLVCQGRWLTLRLGHLNPLRDVPDEAISGVQGRLRNLGYYTGPTTGTLDEYTQFAIELFQREFGLEETGKADAATLSKLEQEHGS